MQFVQIRERRVYEMVFETDSGEEVTLEIDDDTRRRFIDAMNARSGARAQPSTAGQLKVEYALDDDPNEIMLEMNDRLAALGLPVVGEEEADGVDQL